MSCDVPKNIGTNICHARYPFFFFGSRFLVCILHVDIRIKTLNASWYAPRIFFFFLVGYARVSLELFIIFHRVGLGHAKDMRSCIRAVYQPRCKSLFAALSVCLVALARIYPGRYVSIYLPTSGCCKRRYLRRIMRDT